MELRLRTPLADDPRVVRALVIILEARQHLASTVHPVRLLLAELIRNREQERYQRALALRLDAKNVQTDAFRRRRIIE